MEFRDLKAQYAILRGELDAAVLRVLSQGHYIGGPEVALLEERLAAFVGTRYCVTCANGTDALQLALMVEGVGPGDAVFVPDFTFCATAEAPSLLGATPVFVDVDRRTFCLDPAALERAVAAVSRQGELRPRAVIAVDLFGLPAPYPKIQQVCERFGLLLLEDGAQAMGGLLRGQRCGSWGSMATTSFFPAKPLGCYGDGGALFTNDPVRAELARSYAVHGKGSAKYDNVRVGINSRLDTVQAAVLLVKLAAFERFELDEAQKAADAYGEALAAIPNLELPWVPEGSTSAWAQYTVVLPLGCDRAGLQRFLKERAIPTAVYYPRPLHAQPAFAGRSICLDGCPVATELSQRVMSLPMGPYLTASDGAAVAAALREGLEELTGQRP